MLSRECLAKIVSHCGEDSILLWSMAHLTVQHQLLKNQRAVVAKLVPGSRTGLWRFACQ